jgi:hypothetical protein
VIKQVRALQAVTACNSAPLVEVRLPASPL